MVKHGTNKKRRSGRTGKTKLTNKNFIRIIPKKFHDETVKSNWDNSKTAIANLSAMGLQVDVNKDITRPDQVTGENSATAVELFNIPESGEFPKKTKARIMLPQSVADQKYIARLLAKHGRDYKKMERDIKMNNMQHTETKLENMGTRFLDLSEKQRVVDLPDNM
mmetsp:Transcript_37166/g.54693  ORF Transcript_37166/g.54693 Transcript_37166/m.54693 type:complete len:165 (+) Transcript_37166:99-593(+)